MNFKKKYRDKHQGQRCFVIGNAPSLKDEDLSLLQNEIVFIVNKGYHALTIGLDHYDYYVLVDERVYDTDHKEIQEKINCDRFYINSIVNNKNYLSGPKEKFVPINKKIIKEPGNKDIINNKFPKSFESGWGETRSVVFDASLIAFFMGFKNIYLLGADLYHDPNNSTHFYAPSKREESSRGEINSKPQVVQSIIKNINNYFKKNNVTISNLSKGFIYKNLMNTNTLEEIINEKSI